MYIIGFIVVIIAIVLIRSFIYRIRLNKQIKTDPRYRFLDTDEDKIIYESPECICTEHYLKTKVGIKKVFCYEDFLWVYPFRHQLLTTRSFGLTLIAYTKNGERHEILSASGIGKKVRNNFTEIMRIIQEKNPDCLVGDSEDNHQQYLAHVQYHS